MFYKVCSLYFRPLCEWANRMSVRRKQDAKIPMRQKTVTVALNSIRPKQMAVILLHHEVKTIRRIMVIIFGIIFIIQLHLV